MRQSINSTLDRIPVINTIKRFIERVTPVQVKFQYKKLKALKKRRVEVFHFYFTEFSFF
jgi:hypothetical protein